MDIGNVIFDENTNYDDVTIIINKAISALVAISCGCSCNTREDRILLTVNKYMKAAIINKDNEDVVRYHDCIQSAYYELKKLDC